MLFVSISFEAYPSSSLPWTLLESISCLTRVYLTSESLLRFNQYLWNILNWYDIKWHIKYEIRRIKRI